MSGTCRHAGPPRGGLSEGHRRPPVCQTTQDRDLPLTEAGLSQGAVMSPVLFVHISRWLHFLSTERERRVALLSLTSAEQTQQETNWILCCHITFLMQNECCLF